VTERTSGGRGLSPRDLVEVAAARLAVSLWVLAAGFRAVSDDDYARVTLAQAWALAPKLDPTGTSWLPLPFWLNGAAMLVFGRSLLVAQIVAVLLGVASSLLVAIAAHGLTGERRTARLAAHFATLLGWSAWLGVATVPECFTAALTLFGAASLATRSPERRAWGALALFAATLSRYEPWPVAMAFAAWNVDAPARPDRPSARQRMVCLATSLLAVAGPLLWTAWNHLSRGDAFEFVSRVTAYRRALGERESGGALSRLVAYPIAFAREMPEIVVPAVVVVGLALAPRLRSVIALRFWQGVAPLSLAAIQIVALSFALVKDGAPTHHPERAMLFPALALVVFVSAVTASVASKLPRAVALAAAGALFVRAVATPAILREREVFVHREDEVRIGAAVAANVPAGAKVYVEVTDYGYFAVLARSGRPEDFVLDRDLDPRHPTEPRSFATADDLAAWARERGIGYAIESTPKHRTKDLYTPRFPETVIARTATLTLSRVPPAPR